MSALNVNGVVHMVTDPAKPPVTCPACLEKRLHTHEDWRNHPLAGHGYAPELGWTHPEAQRASEKERKEIRL